MVGALLASFSTASLATSSSTHWWNLNCYSPNGSRCQNDIEYSSNNGITATVKAYGTSGANNTYERRTLYEYTNSSGDVGLGSGAGPAAVPGGVGPYNEVSPNHGFDNQDAQEFALIHFTWDVALESIDLSWVGNDDDISVLAWQGGNFSLNSHLVGKTAAQLDGLGWTPISNFDAGGTGNTSVYNDGTNTGGDIVSSLYWLVGAYNANFASAGCASGVCATGAKDYFKLNKLHGTHHDNDVPIPGTVALLALGLVLMRTKKTR